MRAAVTWSRPGARPSGCATCGRPAPASCASAAGQRCSAAGSSPTTRRCRCSAPISRGGRRRSASSSRAPGRTPPTTRSARSRPGTRRSRYFPMGPEEFRAAGHELIDWIADYRARIPQLPVQAQVEPGEVAGKLQSRAPEEPEPFGRILADLDGVVVPGVTQVQHPRYFGWFPSNASLGSVLGDLAASGLGALGITWQSAPALTEVEEVVVEWLRELTALPESWKGVIQDTASSGCLVALLAARERATDYSEVRGGLQAEGAPLTVYTTEHAHSSVLKAVALAGFGRDNLRLIEVNPVTYAMRPEALAAAIEADVAAG